MLLPQGIVGRYYPFYYIFFLGRFGVPRAERDKKEGTEAHFIIYITRLALFMAAT